MSCYKSTHLNHAIWCIYLLLESCPNRPFLWICACYIFCLVVVPAPRKSHQGTKHTTVFPDWMAKEPCCWLLEGELLCVTKRLTVCDKETYCVTYCVFSCVCHGTLIITSQCLAQWNNGAGKAGTLHTVLCTLYTAYWGVWKKKNRKHSLVDFFCILHHLKY